MSKYQGPLYAGHTMVKSYLKFEHSKTFGQICSSTSNVLWIADDTSHVPTKSSTSGQAVVGANEDVLIWDIRKGELLSSWTCSDNNAQVTVIARNQADPDVFAVGYDDGRIRVWLYSTATVYTTFNGHKSAITCLAFDKSGVRLASGSKDTDLILWNLVAEVGLFRLRGHKDQITALSFLHSPGEQLAEEDGSFSEDGIRNVETQLPDESGGFLLSTSKDALLKLWDLSTQYCIETHVAQSNGECWALGLSPDQSGCITAGNDGELRAWAIDTAVLLKKFRETHPLSPGNALKLRGTFYRQGKDRTICISFHPRKDYIAIHGSEKAIELWRIRSDTEIQKRLSRKRKRKREKGAEALDEDKDNVLPDGRKENAIDESPILTSEVFVPYLIVRTSGKVRSIDWAGGKSGKSVSLLAATSNNQVEVYIVSVADKKPKSDETPDYNRSFSVDMPGHRSDIRCLALSSDDRMLASASHGSLKIWNIRTQNCIRTLDCGYALCATFLPGDKIVVLGTKEGTLEIFDIASSALLENLTAHDGDIWSLQVHPDGKSLITGSADKSVKFWSFRVVQEEILGTTRTTPRLALVHSRTLKVSDDILSIRFTPDARLLALATLDSTVKVFFVDSLKLFLTLYGHKLPVLSIDISYDSKLIVTSSADKNVRIWGLDFGDCHKAFFAHQDSVLSVAFVPTNANGNGHHFFSASKDKLVKYFDGDKFEQIQKLQGHHGEIWAMAVAHSGHFVVTASHDKSVRVWTQTNEQVFLEEEREKELEELYESTLATGLEQDDMEAEGQDGETDERVVRAGKQRVETLMAGEKIAEALEIGMEDLEVVREYEAMRKVVLKAALPQRNPVFLAHGGVSASAYVSGVFQRIPAAALQDALLVLRFSQLPALLKFLVLWAKEGRNIALTCRVLLFMLKVHQRQVVSSGQLRGVLEDMRLELRRRLKREKEELGFNLAGLRVLGRRVGDEEGAKGMVDVIEGEVNNTDEDTMETTGRGVKKRAFVNVA